MNPRLSLVRAPADPLPSPPTPPRSLFRPHLRPRTPAHLRAWLALTLNIEVPSEPDPRAGTGPLAYLWYAFDEPSLSAPPKPDAVVWACRGGGKTFYAALATALDLVFKPGIEVKALGGSLEQSQRLHAHLRRFFEHPVLRPLVDGAVTERRLRLINGSSAETLAQSHTSVRGTRPHKLRCDEAELFDESVWSAAQLAPRSGTLRGRHVQATIEALSTCHEPHGLMSKLIAEARPASSNSTRPEGPMGCRHGWSERGPAGAAAGSTRGVVEGTILAPEGRRELFPDQAPPRRLFKWGITEVLETCPEHRPCGTCPLLPECAGRAKVGVGHVSIDDAIRMKRRVSLPRWESEMLCLRPRRDDSVYPEFDESVHVRASLDAPSPAPVVLAGMDFGFRAPTVFLWALHHPETDTLHIIDEHHAARLTLEQHLRAIEARGHPRPSWTAIDPAGRAAETQSGLSHAAVMKQRGMKVRARGSTISHGVELVRARLRPAEPHAAPRLYIHPRCAALIESLTAYHYPPAPSLSNDPVKDGPDHAADALRYLVTNLDAGWAFQSDNYLKG